jgi:hypothetical protein
MEPKNESSFSFSILSIAKVIYPNCTVIMMMIRRKT